jgi:hypothetical protein
MMQVKPCPRLTNHVISSYFRVLINNFNKMKEITVDGVVYVPKDSIPTSLPAKTLKGLKYCIVRTYSAGVFAGYVKSRKGKEAVVLNARRIWYWDGAASLSQLAMEGTNKPENCKFPQEVYSIELTEVIEVIPCTEKARLSIKNVSIWKK